ncbi:hypothetical protein N7492_010202 [Penicillium capsulatum]|uniref:Xylanolytic transcriptional activator regulatory domain-containing protein n=1 Tax=Penicillium capsulatum TaxID=69766 RepID=A0A9W9HLY9_9EURO|nr:hypothetical protein N7492_010202 [Penicillium capsulatum]KAJ6112710.1 hypothetical protein N7512_008034 [Penicillium capsulatum]
MINVATSEKTEFSFLNVHPHCGLCRTIDPSKSSRLVTNMPPKKHSPQKKACDACYMRKASPPFPTYRLARLTLLHLDPMFVPSPCLESSKEESLHRRIEQLETALARTTSTQEPVTPTASNTTTPQNPSVENTWEENSPNGNVEIPSSLREPWSDPASTIPLVPGNETTASPNQLGPNLFFNGMSISSQAGLDWISSRTNQEVTESDFCIPIWGMPRYSKFQPGDSQGPFELPDEDETRQTLQSLFLSSVIHAFPILNQELFQATLKIAYEPAEEIISSKSHLSARACLFGALCMASLKPGFSWNLSFDGDVYQERAHHLLMYLADDMSLPTLQTVLILEIVRIFKGHWQGALSLHSTACRIVCSLGGHVDYPSQPAGLEMSWGNEEARHTRLLFWICYMLDKDISLRTGSPPILTDVYCNLTPPDPALAHFAPFTYHNPSRHIPPRVPPSIPYFASSPCLGPLKEKVYRQLFSAHALKEDDNQLLICIRHLDEEIERWKQTIPFDIRPALSISQTKPRNIPKLLQSKVDERMSIQLEYNHLMILIHTMVRKCTSDAPDGTRDLHDVVHSSFDLSLEAGRSTLWCLRLLVDQIDKNALPFITLYATTAALALFLNIIIHPYYGRVQLDLEALMSTGNKIRTVDTSRLKRSEVALIHETSEFFTRLVWLGSCAVAKVKRNPR